MSAWIASKPTSSEERVCKILEGLSLEQQTAAKIVAVSGPYLTASDVYVVFYPEE